MQIRGTETSTDLAADTVTAVLPDRPVRSYPALLSTETVAMAWAREGAPHGAVVVADYQVSPRGRGGLPWTVTPARSVGFTLLLRPDDLSPEREGWPYVAGSLAITDAVGGPATVLEWPDTVLRAGSARTLASIGVHVELGPLHTDWLTVTVLVRHTRPPRAPLLARLVTALERRLSAPPDPVLAAYRERSTTLGRQVRARMIPMGPGGPEITGEAVDILADGALVLRTARGSRVAVRPQNLGLLEAPEGPIVAPENVLGTDLR